ncbi:hypothetical protein [Carbonactinospora thermoautotrophica]|nr:hypothetical protein [Carbonactinospora thermoautotrophica]
MSDQSRSTARITPDLRQHARRAAHADAAEKAVALLPGRTVAKETGS